MILAKYNILKEYIKKLNLKYQLINDMEKKKSNGHIIFYTEKSLNVKNDNDIYFMSIDNVNINSDILLEFINFLIEFEYFFFIQKSKLIIY